MNISFNGGNVMIVNGRIVSSGEAFGSSKKFDEKKDLQADSIDRITVRSDVASIIVTASNSNTICAHFYGEAITVHTPTLSITQNGREAIIALCVDGSIMCGDLTLAVNIPMRILDALNVNSYNGNIEVKADVSAKEMKLNTYNGFIESEGLFAKIYAITHNGSTDVFATAKCDIEVEAISHNGNVTVELQNIATSNISVSTRNGSARDRFRSVSGGYTAYGRAQTHNGNATVR